MNIPKITLIGITTAACTDPLIGDWNLNEVCLGESEEAQCQEFPYTSDGMTYYLEMSINEDFTGEMRQITSGNENASYSFPVTAEKEAANTYKIKLDTSSEGGNITTLNCTLASKELQCSADLQASNIDYTFEKE